MRIQHEAGLGISIVMVLQVMTALLAITLLSRMGPAIEHILEENVYSEEAIEEMLFSLATAEPGPPPAGFVEALARAQANVTEPAEQPLLDRVANESTAAFAGDHEALVRVAANLRELGRINRASMVQADEEAKSLSLAGAWAAAILGTLAFGLSILTSRRLRLRLEVPLSELRRVTQAVRAGNAQARAAKTSGPAELKDIAADVNWILDHWTHEPRSHAETETDDVDIRRALGFLLDGHPDAAILVDDERIVAASTSFDPDSLADISAARKGTDSAWSKTPIEGTRLVLLRHAATAET